MPHVIFMALAPIFFVMALGYLAGRTRTIDNHHVGEINALVMDFALPACLFVATASTQRSGMMAQGSLFAILSAVMLVPYSFWYVFERAIHQTFPLSATRFFESRLPASSNGLRFQARKIRRHLSLA